MEHDGGWEGAERINAHLQEPKEAAAILSP